MLDKVCVWRGGGYEFVQKGLETFVHLVLQPKLRLCLRDETKKFIQKETLELK